ncbi:MAG: glycosyltransferase [Thermodesulfobacteriota bacterium]|nr:glycosyltransferase [Thermodesulfobacteriota bacterium]
MNNINTEKKHQLLSVVIPCKNEEKFIGRCLDALLDNRSEADFFEIIVVDNGSTDNTVSVLKKYMHLIHFYQKKGGTISALRNFGASKSTGEWLAFIDADVIVDGSWYTHIFNALAAYQRHDINNKRLIIGSTYALDDHPTWVETTWYNYLTAKEEKRECQYINGGNLIIHSDFFRAIGGFDPAYETGEDEKICQDARLQHGKIVSDKTIKAVHLGYPKTIGQFFKRELWHGKALIKNIKTPWKDRALLLALYNIFIVTIICFLAIAFPTLFFILTILTLGLMILPLFLLSIKNLSGLNISVFRLTALFFVYGIAKSMAFIRSVLTFLAGARTF